MRKTVLLSFICTGLLCIFSVAGQTIYYVNIQNGKDTNDGLKWSSAFMNLQTAIDSAKAGDEIRVAAGVYLPTEKIARRYGGGGSNNDTPATDRHRSFLIRKDLKIYGGFPANATDATGMNSRDWQVHRTILSGDFEGNDNDSFENMEENAYHVMVLFDATPAMVLDGFYITGGCADDTKTIYMEDSRNYYVTGDDGGGIYAYSPIGVSSPTLSNLVFFANYAGYAGGAIFNFALNKEASPAISYTTFTHNKAGRGYGGGLAILGTTVGAALTYIHVTGNESYLSGGGLYFVSTEVCAPRLTNTVISGNYAGNGNGAGLYISTHAGDAQPYIINSTICGNKMESVEPKDGGGVMIYPEGVSKAHVYNSVIRGNKGIDFDNFFASGKRGSENVIAGSLIGGIDAVGDGNLPGETEPLFLDEVHADFAPTTDGDYQLMPGSPLINKGINDYITLSSDLLNNTRVYGGTVDIGAYESQGSIPVDNPAIIQEKAIWSYDGYLYVRISRPATLRVYTADGRLVRQINQLGEGMYQFALAAGFYVVTLSDGTTGKVIIR